MKKSNAAFIKGILPEAIPWYVARRLPPRELLLNWGELIGEYLAERARPICLEPDGLLVLAVRGSALRQELTLNSGQIIAKLSQAGFAVSSLKIVTARLSAHEPLPAAPEHLPPLTPEEERSIAGQVAGVKSPMVRQALQQLLEAGLQAQKK